MAEILNEFLKSELAYWIGKPCYFRLLYKISRDGCSAQTFHQKCDGQGPTVTVLCNTSKTIFGGYLTHSWNSDGSHIKDPSAFLFRLQYNGSYNPVVCPVSQAATAGYGNSCYGPTFGGGHDIKTFTGTINKSYGDYFTLNGDVSKLGHSYDLKGGRAATSPTTTFK